MQAATPVRNHPLRRIFGRLAVGAVLSMTLIGGAWAAGAACPSAIEWVQAPKIGQILAQDSGMPEFNPAKGLNQVTYVGRFVLVPQIGVVAGLPKRPLAVISGLDAPKLRIAERVNTVEWRMINASEKPVALRIESAKGVAAQCRLPGARVQGKDKRFAYLRWFWKPAPKGHYRYVISQGKAHVSGSIERLAVPLRYGE